MAAGDRHLDLGAVFVFVNHRSGVHIAGHDGYLQHPARGWADGQKGAVGGAAFVPQRRQDDVGHGLVVLQHLQQRLVEAARVIALGGRDKFVVKAELIEKLPQPGIVVVAEALVRAEGIGNLGQGLAHVLGQHLLLRHVVGHAAQTVHVVGEGIQEARPVAEFGKSAAHHGGAGDLAEGADVRQSRRAVAGFEQHRFIARPPLQTIDYLLGFEKGPGFAGQGGFGVGCHNQI